MGNKNVSSSETEYVNMENIPYNQHANVAQSRNAEVSNINDGTNTIGESGL